jgi:hypothetical protein
LPIRLDDVVRWHRGIFRTTFPHYAGAVRRVPSWFEVRWREGGPFEDGNLRASFPALQGALISLGAAPVHFDQAVAEHDEALGWALRPEAEKRTVVPIVELLARRTDEAAGAGWRRVPRRQ